MYGPSLVHAQTKLPTCLLHTLCVAGLVTHHYQTYGHNAPHMISPYDRTTFCCDVVTVAGEAGLAKCGAEGGHAYAAA